MRFRIFGDGDCPAWWLASLHALAAAPAPAVRALAHCVLAERAPHAAAELDEKKIIEILADTPLCSPSARRRACACVWQCATAARARSCSRLVLARDLQLAGLPRAHAAAIADAADEALRLQPTHAHNFLVNPVTSVSTVPTDTQLVDCIQISITTSSLSPLEGEHEAEHEAEHEGEHVLSVLRADLPELIRQLKRAREAMEGL